MIIRKKKKDSGDIAELLIWMISQEHGREGNVTYNDGDNDDNDDNSRSMEVSVMRKAILIRRMMVVVKRIMK